MLPPNDRAAHLSYLRFLGEVVSLPRTVVTLDSSPRVALVCSPSSSPEQPFGMGNYDPFKRVDFDDSEETDTEPPTARSAGASRGSKSSASRRTVCEWDNRFWRIETLDEWGHPIGHVRFKRRRDEKGMISAVSDGAPAKNRFTAWFGTLWAKVRSRRTA